MDLVARLKRYMEHVNLPISQFADVAQIPRPTLSQILTGRNKKISNELLTKLHTAFPSLNISWLLFGDGSMDIENNSIASESAYYATSDDQNSVQAPSINPQVASNPSIHEPTMPQVNDLPGLGDMQLAAADDFAADTKHPYAQSGDTQKKIKTIIVFYSDNSFEIFNPSH